MMLGYRYQAQKKYAASVQISEIRNEKNTGSMILYYHANAAAQKSKQVHLQRLEDGMTTKYE